MIFEKKELDHQVKEQLKEYTYDIVGVLFEVYKNLPCGFPEYVYQEALEVTFKEKEIPFEKESLFHPSFNGKVLKSYFKMDFMLPRPKGNIIIECKAVERLSDRERNQLFSYMVGTRFPIGILVNFSSYPTIQLEKYYFDRRDNTITSF